MRSSKSQNPEYLNFVYRKELGLTQEELMNEDYLTYSTNLEIIKLIRLKEYEESKRTK